MRLEQIDDETVHVEVGGKVYAIPSHCPHRKGKMVFAYVNERRLRITCPLHHSTFELETGCQVAGPECGSLQVVPLSPRPMP